MPVISTAAQAVIEFKEKYNLTYAELAVTLGKSEQTVKSYCFDKSSKNRRTPPPSVLVQLKTVDRYWSTTGKRVTFFAFEDYI